MKFTHLNSYKKGKKRNILKRVIIKLVQITISREGLHKTIENNMKRYENSNVDGIACFGGIYGIKEGFHKSVLGSGLNYQFEDDFFIIPKKYDFYLTQLYGDYMTYPPEEKRRNHHDIVFKSLTEEYDRNKHGPW